MSTSFAHQSKNLDNPYQPSLLESESPIFDSEKSNKKGKIFTLTEDINQDGIVDLKDLQWEYLTGDGDFRSDEIKKLRDEADIIITNPPFSLFREFIAWVVDANKKFAIIGNKNAITYKEVFPLIKDNKIWSGSMPMGADILFHIPEYMENDFIETKQEGSAYRKIDNKIMARSTGMWFTNLEHGRRHEPLRLMTMDDNLKFNKSLKKEQYRNAYQEYDNYHAIEIPLVNAIPSDFDGVMGVPISFLDKYNPEQFEIIASDYQLKDGSIPELLKSDWNGKTDRGYIENQRMYSRLLIKHKKEVK
nr:adenine-specific methyltransferase EcoRI family protein [Alysiella crassa]